MPPTETKPLYDPNQYAGLFRNVNPFGMDVTTPFAAGLQSQLGGAWSGASGALGGYDPGAFMRQWLAAMPAFQMLTNEATSPLAQEQQNYMQAMVQPTISNVANELSKMNLANSSALPRMVGESLAPTLANLQQQMAQARLGLYQTFGGQAMPLFAQGGQFPVEAALQLYGSAAPSIMGTLGQMYTPNMVAPPIGEQKTPFGNFMDFAGLGLGLAGLFI